MGDAVGVAVGLDVGDTVGAIDGAVCVVVSEWVSDAATTQTFSLVKLLHAVQGSRMNCIDFNIIM